jgi:hypothetical protein
VSIFSVSLECMQMRAVAVFLKRNFEVLADSKSEAVEKAYEKAERAGFTPIRHLHTIDTAS